MSPETTAATTDPAAHAYRVAVTAPSSRSRWTRTAGLIVVGLLNMGGTPTNPGGRRATVIDRATGEVVAEVEEVMGDDVSDVDAVIADLDRLDVAAFEARWL